MASDFLFRLVFSLLWVVFLGIFAWCAHSINWAAGRRTTRHAKHLRAIALVFAGIYLAGALLYALLPSSVSFLSIPLPDSIRLGMVGLGVVGTAFVLWGLVSLGKNWAPSLSGLRTDTVLITTGAYRLVRHPIYLGAFIFLAAQALLAANLFTLVPTVALLTLLYAQLPEEESMLIDRFGDEYREYMKRTPRFMPSLENEPKQTEKD